MGQSRPFRATALVVEDDPMQREMIALLDGRAVRFDGFVEIALARERSSERIVGFGIDGLLLDGSPRFRD